MNPNSEIITVPDAIEILEDYNKWRRGDESAIEQPNPTTIGIAIDLVIAEIKSKNN